ncbi:MAG: thiopurine S-methyltransferase [Nitrosomonas sp.]|nr:thiopurine S-methyltransferase [Nitrosomonas sp.]
MKNYWLDRWKDGNIGFHQSDINLYLCQYWQELKLTSESEVLVPLCGKSRDMLWLREQGHSVLGVELSAIAVQAFFKENNIRLEYDRINGKFDRYKANDINILCGDFFNLSKDNLTKVGAVYDRASLVALPPEIRIRYARHLIKILPPTTQILLITFDYPHSEMEGPPFAVSSGEVEMLYHKHADVRQLAQFDVLEKNPNFQERGLSRIQESIFLLTTIS